MIHEVIGVSDTKLLKCFGLYDILLGGVKPVFDEFVLFLRFLEYCSFVFTVVTITIFVTAVKHIKNAQVREQKNHRCSKNNVIVNEIKILFPQA
jgi:hypothetical protein